MADFHATAGFVTLDNVTFNGGDSNPGSTLSYDGISGSADADLDIVDDNEDGFLDIAFDYFHGPGTTFTGYTISAGGVEYAVFFSGTLYLVALPEDGVGQTTIAESGTSNPFQALASTYLCFGVGTGIATPTGEVAVEALSIGDEVVAADGCRTRVLWIGRQTTHKFLSGSHLQPLRIRSGALGDGLPRRDLIVTADHGLVIDGLVINASALVNGSTIDWVPMTDLEESFTVYHVETENHEVILANGAPAETFIDYLGRQSFDNYPEYRDLHGAERIIREMPRPRISAQRLVPARIKARLGIAAVDDSAEDLRLTA
ncbi:MAG: hypothetical protein EP318_01110 [Rhodobacteraceae bacterium]|nr:MAG: hypothetical protein EP318_01110 [Paracoccaceae bacterium]